MRMAPIPRVQPAASRCMPVILKNEKPEEMRRLLVSLISWSHPHRPSVNPLIWQEVIDLSLPGLSPYPERNGLRVRNRLLLPGDPARPRPGSTASPPLHQG